MNATEAKRRVLAVHPGARCIGGGMTGYDIFESEFLSKHLGSGDNPDEAWIAAAAGLEERNER